MYSNYSTCHLRGPLLPVGASAASGGARTRGAGLGLRFVKVVTERHGGTIHVESVPDEGSCFRLALPRIDVGGL